MRESKKKRKKIREEKIMSFELALDIREKFLIT